MSPSDTGLASKRIAAARGRSEPNKTRPVARRPQLAARRPAVARERTEWPHQILFRGEFDGPPLGRDRLAGRRARRLGNPSGGGKESDYTVTEDGSRKPHRFESSNVNQQVGVGPFLSPAKEAFALTNCMRVSDAHRGARHLAKGLADIRPDGDSDAGTMVLRSLSAESEISVPSWRMKFNRE